MAPKAIYLIAAAMRAFRRKQMTYAWPDMPSYAKIAPGKILRQNYRSAPMRRHLPNRQLKPWKKMEYCCSENDI